MTDWAPQVVVIEKIEKHPNADALDIATVLGDYPVIVKRDEYKVNDITGYIPIDSIVPDIQDFYFLCPNNYEQYEENGEIKRKLLGPKYPLGSVPEKYRIIKAKNIRGIYSQGMLVKLNQPMNIGDSIENVFELKKWEEPEEENIVFKVKGKNAESAPKGWAIPYYDIDGLRKYINCLSEEEEIVLTEKLHGSNASFCYDGERLWVKSRNFYKKKDIDDMWWDVAIRNDLETKLSKYPGLVFFGELIGQVKGFRYDATIVNGKLLTKIYFFDIWDTKSFRFLDYDDFIQIIKDLELNHVPELYRGKWLDKDTMYSYAEGLSTLNNKHIREGFVIKTTKERFEPKLQSRMQLKLVGKGYNLQK